MDKIKQLIFDGRYIEAIKVYREQEDIGLKEAKAFIDGLREEIEINNLKFKSLDEMKEKIYRLASLTNKEFLLDLAEEAYYLGTEDGHQEGYADSLNENIVESREEAEEAWEEGHSEGRNEGYTEGYEEGQEEGSKQSYDSGYEDGKETGYDSGYTDGQSNGFDEGYEQGKVETEIQLQTP